MSASDLTSIREAIDFKRKELAALEARLAGIEEKTRPIETHQIDGLVNQSEPQATVSRSQQDGNADRPLKSLYGGAFSQAEYQRYGRQLILPEIGITGQNALQRARVLIVGVGGLGCPASAYLAGAGVGTMGLVDGDVVDTSNLHRQILHSTARVGVSKVTSAVQYLQELNPLITYRQFHEHLSPATAVDIFKQFDLVLDCTDHPTSRYLISDTCVLTGRSLVSASALKADGQLVVLNHPARPPGDSTGGPCYRCIFPEPPPADTLVSCGEGGVLGPVVGTMGVLQALEAIKLLCSKEAEHTAPKMLLFAAYGDPQFRSVRMRPRRKACAVCSAQSTITEKSLNNGCVDYVAFCGTSSLGSMLPPDARASAQELAEMAMEPDTITIDTREPTQFDICALSQSVNIPWTGHGDSWLQLVSQNEQVRGAKDVFVICRFGNDSQLAARALLDRGSFRRIHDVEGGFRAWRQQVDPDWPDY